MARLRLIADDLTGALDSGCAFASERTPVLIGLPWQSLPAGPLVAISTESREGATLSGEAAVAASVGQMGRDCRGETLWFKKIDSVLRGNPIGETVAAFRAGGFGHCVFAPAFPEMGRITRGGRHYVQTAGTDEYKAIGPDLVAAFRTRGIKAEVRRFDESDDALPLCDQAAEVSIVDAETQDALSARIGALRLQMPGTPLWAGAGGLAAALSRYTSVIPFPPIRAMISGTRHTVARAQIAHALRVGIVSTNGIDDGGRARTLLIAPSWHSETAAETHLALRERIPAIDISPADRTAVFVIGGDTLTTVLQTVASAYLECTGQATIGVPICRIRGGYWDGVTLLTKSGGFGQDTLLEDVFMHCP